MSKADYLRVISLFVDHHKPQDGKRYHLFYKSKGSKNRYDNMVVKVEGNEIVIITIMQFHKASVMDYFSKPGELRLMLEDEESIFIVLE